MSAHYSEGRIRTDDGTVHAVIVDDSLRRHECSGSVDGRWTRPERSVTCRRCMARLRRLQRIEEAA